MAFTDCVLMYAVRIYYRDFEKILCFWLVPLGNGGVPLKSIHVIIEYVNSNTHGKVRFIGVLSIINSVCFVSCSNYP